MMYNAKFINETLNILYFKNPYPGFLDDNLWVYLPLLSIGLLWLLLSCLLLYKFIFQIDSIKFYQLSCICMGCFIFFHFLNGIIIHKIFYLTMFKYIKSLSSNEIPDLHIDIILYKLYYASVSKETIWSHLPDYHYYYSNFHFNEIYYFINTIILIFAFIAFILLKNFFLKQKKTFILIMFYFAALSILYILTYSNNFFDIFILLESLFILQLTLYFLFNKNNYLSEWRTLLIKYFFMNITISLIYLLGIAFITIYAPTTACLYISCCFLCGPSNYVYLALGSYICFLIFLIFKLGLIPFSFWQVYIYRACPSSILYVISIFYILPLIVVCYKTIITFSYFFYLIRYYLLVLGLLSLIYGSIQALIAINIKEFLAFTSIVNLSLIFISLILTIQTQFELLLPIFYIIIYLIGSSIFWWILFSIESTLEVEKTEINETIRYITRNDFLNFYYKNPQKSIIFLISILLLMGFPPLIGFFPKYGLLLVIIDNISNYENNQYFFSLVLLIYCITYVINIYYYMSFIIILFNKSINQFWIDLKTNKSFLIINYFEISLVLEMCWLGIATGLFLTVYSFDYNLYNQSFEIVNTIFGLFTQGGGDLC